MGGKGQRRREKNYAAAHGVGRSRLPPPPDPTAVDSLPSKLRKLLAFTSSSPHTSHHTRTKSVFAADEKKLFPKNDINPTITKVEEGDADKNFMADEHIGNSNEISHHSVHEKKKKKRKRKTVTDLRFQKELEELGAVGSKRKERKKKYLEAKKNKQKKVKTAASSDFPGREQIKFGDVVQAPPRLNVIPKSKVLKTGHDASRERLRLQAVEAYRNRRGWASRPGINLPPPAAITPSL